MYLRKMLKSYNVYNKDEDLECTDIDIAITKNQNIYLIIKLNTGSFYLLNKANIIGYLSLRPFII